MKGGFQRSDSKVEATEEAISLEKIATAKIIITLIHYLVCERAIVIAVNRVTLRGEKLDDFERCNKLGKFRNGDPLFCGFFLKTVQFTVDRLDVLLAGKKGVSFQKSFISFPTEMVIGVKYMTD